jgi:quercetin dioxygenase-like cupin family protein
MEFQPLRIEHGLLLDLSDDTYPTSIYGWSKRPLDLPANATHYGIVLTGSPVITDTEEQSHTFLIQAEMFFVWPGEGVLVGHNSSGLIISRLGYRGLRQIGGPIEAEGRLRYIDGCTDTLLVCPPRLGEPCLNHLHIPPHTSQSQHTHPSERIGVILRGRGECRTPDGVYSLTPGMGWRIPTGCLHSFYTEDESLDVVAWHPDSDFGPTDENHPMINRTFLKTS